ncbi:hypothetical protein CORC01_03288 [Colletotrichum orchidophilum]|uniref:Uncharacterized protein n=1 Tax=Colletotrichum orchidophilum TaxID=1209926 RepID=A0A1G4BJB3_9PEZI|nr:uncharacterized protein CORC01_03288 [Colletotrichum orchidophilum]OHF01532.1 hypothetical protein CORC01_03288 [Colletotrichum orchidophilum]
MEPNRTSEAVALVGQPNLIPDPTMADSTSALVRYSGGFSQRLQVILSNCQTETETERELWDDVEIHRRSADMYMDQYLDHLQKVHAERPRHVHTIENSDDEVSTMGLNSADMTREQWRLMISRDSLARDLLAMHETLEYLKPRAAPSPRQGVLAASALSTSAGV